MSHPSSLFIKIITRILLVIGLALGILLIPNLLIFDEQLSPEITALLGKPIQADSTGNAAVYIYGMNAESSLDLKVAGEALLAELRKKHNRGEPASLSDEEVGIIFNGHDFDKTWPELYPTALKCNPRDQIDCFESILNELKATPITNERLLTQIERYRFIVEQLYFSEDVSYLDFTSPVPNYAISLQLSRLLAAEAYLHHGMDGLIESTSQDIKFWHIVLKEGQSLLGKMVAINALRGNLFALSYGISKEPKLTENQIRNLRSLVNPIANKDVNIEDAIKADFHIMVNSIEQFLDLISTTGETKQWLLYPMTQPNATINLSYRQFYKPAITLSQMSPVDFYESAQTPTQPFEFSRMNPYNLGGKFNMPGPWRYSGYIGRVHDLTGLYALVRLQLELKINASDDVLAAIRASSFKNPYTQKPYDYDTNKKELGFRCFDMKDACRIQL